MSKYMIVPKENIADVIIAVSPEDAMTKFAIKMNLDMNSYFKAIEADKYDIYMDDMFDRRSYDSTKRI